MSRGWCSWSVDHESYRRGNCVISRWWRDGGLVMFYFAFVKDDVC